MHAYTLKISKDISVNENEYVEWKQKNTDPLSRKTSKM
jgi:hypothetical protein